MFGFDSPDFARDGADWPHRRWSSFHQAGGLRLHVQRAGSGPVCLLLHGTGASTHSYRDLMPRLAPHFDVVAPDLPGHGFSGAPPFAPLSLPTMAKRIAALLTVLDVAPSLVVGHSAGAAIAVRLVLDGAVPANGIVSFNGALRPFRGSAGPLFSLMARALFLNPLAPRVFAASADRRRVERLLENTGSRLGPEGVALYQRLFRRSGHVAGALSMMANWDLAPLRSAMTGLTVPLLLVAAEGDRAVEPEVAHDVAREVASARVLRLPGRGHLAHEEDPDEAAAIVLAFAREVGALAPAEGASAA